MKRFYSKVSATAHAEGEFAILLDAKPVKTPKRQQLLLPNAALGDAVADEWRAQGETIESQKMPLSRLAFAALDVVTPERDTIAQQVLDYALNDLLCYRAEEPPALVVRQAAAWDPMLDWAAKTYGVRLKVGPGILHVAQPPEAITQLRRAVARCGAFELAALHTATTITGSLILALALVKKRLSAREAFAAAALDELYQAEKWGCDAEAEQRRTVLLSELTAAGRFLRLLEA